jgi:hypothetical protein
MSSTRRNAIAILALCGCGQSNATPEPTGTTTLTGTATLPLDTSGDGTSAGPGSGPGTGDGTADASVGDDGQTKFDLGPSSGECLDQAPGIYCKDTTAIECDGAGNALDVMNCLPDLCIDGQGCVACLAGEYACKGPHVMSCNTAGPTPTWQIDSTCDPAAQQVCDASLGMCVPLAPIGDITPTGEYYQYSMLDVTAQGFSQVSDVDSYGNRIYFVAMLNFSQLTIGVYDVTLDDSDNDGVLEPNQHPDYPDAQGPIEERIFTFVESFPLNNPGAFPNIMETYATATSLVYSGPNNVSEYDLATGTVSQVAPMPTWIGSTLYPWIAFLGYDEINDVWYSGNEAARRVFQYDADTQTWGYAFEFPVLAGDHMDGMEVVVDQTTATPYVYVSDMTSNFIGQYRFDREQGWVQENLFSYVENTGALVEGFGFGALNHFWVGSLGQTFYELGGGDLTQYIDPAG